MKGLFDIYGERCTESIAKKSSLKYFVEIKEDERRATEQPCGCEERRAKSDADIVKIGNEEKFFDKFEKR